MSDAEADTFDHEAFLKTLTGRPGVYQMFDADDTLLYVGKAKNLKKRVSSYFRNSGLTSKIIVMVSRIHHIEVTITSTESTSMTRRTKNDRDRWSPRM